MAEDKKMERHPGTMGGGEGETENAWVKMSVKAAGLRRPPLNVTLTHFAFRFWAVEKPRWCHHAREEPKVGGLPPDNRI